MKAIWEAIAPDIRSLSSIVGGEDDRSVRHQQYNPDELGLLQPVCSLLRSDTELNSSEVQAGEPSPTSGEIPNRGRRSVSLRSSRAARQPPCAPNGFQQALIEAQIHSGVRSVQAQKLINPTANRYPIANRTSSLVNHTNGSAAECMLQVPSLRSNALGLAEDQNSSFPQRGQSEIPITHSHLQVTIHKTSSQYDSFKYAVCSFIKAEEQTSDLSMFACVAQFDGQRFQLS